MSLSQIKTEILETLLLNGKPMKAAEIAKEIKKEPQPTMGHVLGLIKVGYVAVAEKGLYALTDSGKSALGVEKTSKEKAKAIMSYAPHDKAFLFYEDVGKPLNIHAHSLQDFSNKLAKASVKSVEFHMNRGDFEAWFKGLGDNELAKKTALLKEKGIIGEELAKKLHNVVEARCLELMKLADQSLP
jgi:Fe2+ or Zn2+ uptake regulation protein